MTAASPAPQVLIIGAGPTGLSLANMLGQRGIRTVILEALPELIDYPRGVGLDDESFRSMQSMGLIDAVLPHTTPQHISRVVNGKGKVFAEMSPATQEYGWPRRNAFIQPLVDAELARGLERFEHVSLRFGHTVESIEARGDQVEVTALTASGKEVAFRAEYVVGCDGGRSETRKYLGASFDGQSPSTRWLVVDMPDDPIGSPNVFLGGDPRRPYVSIGLPHAIRRFEFMLFPDEPDDKVHDPDFIAHLLTPHLPNPARTPIGRKRVFTHHSRIADSFRKGRVMIAGDAAHLMPVWQGQGYNSGVRDATNLAWKLSAVVQGKADESLLDTYSSERHEHAKAMIDISTAFGRFLKPTNRFQAAARDAIATVLTKIPGVTEYFSQMKYKPMPRYRSGVVVDPDTTRAGTAGDRFERMQISAFSTANVKLSPVGTQFPQPWLTAPDGSVVRMDDLIGTGWAILSWGTNPEQIFDETGLEKVRQLGATCISIRPITQMAYEPSTLPGAIVVGDHSGAAKKWFDQRPTSVVFLRPDRFVAAACIVNEAPETLDAVLSATRFIPRPVDAATPSDAVASHTPAWLEEAAS